MLSDSSPRSAGLPAVLQLFQRQLSGQLPFREDVTCLTDLFSEAQPVLEALATAYGAPAGSQGTMHEAYALLTLLCRRAGLLGATPTASLAIVQALVEALREAGVQVDAHQRDQLAMVAVEGYCAGRDEQRERTLRDTAARSQVWVALSPGCYALFLNGSHHAEQLEQIVDNAARELFRGDARGVLVDLSRLSDEPNEECARALVGFMGTLLSLGAQVFVYGTGPGYAAWFERLGLGRSGAVLTDSFSQALHRALRVAGHELRPRGGLVSLLDRVRSGTR